MCPVCGFKDGGGESCPACGCMRGRDYSDSSDYHRAWELRKAWAGGGCQWASGDVPAPSGWSPLDGLFRLVVSGGLGPMEYRL